MYIYIYKVERVKRKVSKRFFPVDIEEMYADVSLCAESIRWMEREREENKYRATKRGENPSLPTQVSPSPPVCLTALAYGHECQCFSRKHDLGWNNPFGKGLRLSSSVSFFSPFFLFLSFFLSSFCSPLSPATIVHGRCCHVWRDRI